MLENALVVINVELIGRSILFIAAVYPLRHLNSPNINVVVKTAHIIHLPLAAASGRFAIYRDCHRQMGLSVEVKVRPHLSLIINHLYLQPFG